MTDIDFDDIGVALGRQLVLFEPDVPQINLHDYDLIIINSSAGKDSLATLIVVYRMAIEQNYPLDRIVVQYNALGDRVTWPGTADMGPNTAALVRAFGRRPGTAELAARQAEALGLRLIVSRRNHATDVDLLDHIERHGRFPNDSNRFCTSDHKTGPGSTVITAEYRAIGDLGRPPRLAYVFGFRRAESSGRAKKSKNFTSPGAPVVVDARSNTMRSVDEWYPVFDWPDEQVWSAIRASGLPSHWAYQAGMSRLSCSFCVLAGGDDLILAAALRPDVALAYWHVEQANLARGRACGDMKGRVFQEGKPRKDGTVKQRTMTDIITAARTHPIITELGLNTEILDSVLAL